MARIRKNLFLEGLSGKLGNQLVLRNLKDGRTIVCVRPDFSKRVLSKDQKKHHERFKVAAAYAKAASKREPLYAQLAEGTMKNPYNVALGDWFHPPVIHRVKRHGKAIRVQASDDVRVTGVLVMIFDEEGKAIEEGNARETKSGWWEYVSKREGKVIAVARDLAGNAVKAELASGA